VSQAVAGSNDPASRFRPRLRDALSRYGIYVFLAAMVLLGGALSPNFIGAQNISNLLLQFAPLAIVVIGQAFVILVRGLDLSVASMMATAAVITTGFTGVDADVPAIAALSIAIGLATGAVNGLLVTKRSVSPFLATLAGPDRVLGVTVNGEQLSFRVAAVAKRFPGIPQEVSSDFLVVDRPALESALNTSAPGTGFATELWLDTDASKRAAVEARLRKPPFTALAVASRSRLEHSLQAEPVARAALAMLETAALTAIVLALLGLVLGTLSERRDEAAELFDLEAQGVAPAGLRRQLRLRASLAGLAGAIGGIATGVVLSLLVVRFVELTANATSPEPPLELVLDWPLLVAAGLIAAAAAVALVGAATWRAFRARVPARYGDAT